MVPMELLFPKFTNITKESLNVIDSYFKIDEPYSDLSPISLYCWDAKNENEYTFLNDNLIIKMKDYLNDNFFYIVYGNKDLNETVAQLTKQNKLVLKCVPKSIVEKLTRVDFLEIKPDRDAFDYVISIRDFCQMNGGRYREIRKKTRNFMDKYKNQLRLQIMNLEDKATQEEMLNLTQKWCQSKDFDVEQMKNDILSIKKFISLSNMFNLYSIGLYLDNRLIAYTLNEILDNGWAMGHFGKSDRNIKHASLYVELVTNMELQKMGIKFINIQQDTGIPGLRESKLSYQPVKFLEKYTIRAKS